MDPAAVSTANEKLWAAHHELHRRQLTNDDPRSLRAEWMRYYREADSVQASTPAEVPAAASPPPPAPLVTSCRQCWTDDYEKEISVEAYGRYYKKYKPDGTEDREHVPKKFKILAPIKTGAVITVQVRFKAEPQTGVSAADATAAKTKLEAGVKKHWNGKFVLEVNDPQCGTESLGVEYKIVWVTSGPDYTIKIHQTYPREGVTGDVMDVSKSTSAWIYAHEFGHCVGLPDEYSYSTATETVKYIKPDGTLDTAISAPFNGKLKTAPDATIMAAYDNTTTLTRHGWNIAIEVQELLTTSLGRSIKCSIK